MPFIRSRLYRRALTGWTVANMAAGVAVSTMLIYGETIAGSARRFRMPRAGKVKSISCQLDAAPTAGSITLTLYKNGASTGDTMTINIGEDGKTLLLAGTSYVANDTIELRYNTDAGLAPLTLDMNAWIGVEETA
jgi:hypothetical protein